jgi:hypothetical protein
MSKRFRQKPPPATDSLAGTDDPRRLSRDASAELHHLVEMFGMLGQAMPEALAIGPAMDLAAELTEEYRDLGRDLREGVRRILREAAPKPREAAVVGEISDIAPLLTELSREVELPSPELAPDEVAAAFVGLIGLVNEVGYEEHSASVFPLPLPDGEIGLVWQPVSREATDIALMERVMDRLELWAGQTDIGYMERQASRHWFDRFSLSKYAEQMEFSHYVREQEFTFAGREFVSLGDTVARNYAAHKGATLRPAVRRMLEALVRSRASLFAVRERQGASSVMEDLADGKRYAVHEHNESLVYDAGSVALGRLLPRGGGAYARSVGMVFSHWPEGAASIGQTLVSADGLGLDREIVLEGLLTQAQGGTIPRTVRPAASKREAHDLLADFSMALREAGFARDIAPDAASPELRALGEATGHQVLEMQVDNVLAEWFRALSEQAGIPGPGVSPLKGRKKKPKKKKRRR